MHGGVGPVDVLDVCNVGVTPDPESGSDIKGAVKGGACESIGGGGRGGGGVVALGAVK